MGDVNMIKFYTSNCAKCKVLKQLMDKNKIEYEEIDDEDVYLKLAEDNGIMSMPFAEIDGKIINNQELIKYINEIGE